MNGEAGGVPGKDQARSVLVEQAGLLKETDDFVPEELLRGRGAHVRHGHAMPRGGPAATSDECVNVWMQVADPPNVRDIANMPGRKPFSSPVATFIRLQAVCQAAVHRRPSTSR